MSAVRRLGVLFVSLLMLVSACSGSDTTTTTTTTGIEPMNPDQVLATVNGRQIPITDLLALHPDFGALRPDEIASSVLLLILRSAFYGEAEDQFAFTVPDEDRQAALTLRTERYPTVERMNEVLLGLNETVLRLNTEADLDALRTTMGRFLAESGAEGFDIEAAYRNWQLTNAEVCVRHIQVISEPGFELVQGRIDAGEDFATVARENSLDTLVDRPEGEPGGGGDLLCRTPAATPFPADAIDGPVGEYFGPVFSDVGTHLVYIYERTSPPLEEVRDEVIELGVLTQGDSIFNAWAVDVISNAEVTIDSTFGTWGPQEGTNDIPTVIPPG